MGVAGAFTRPAQLAPDKDLTGFCCGDDVVDRWADKHAAHAKERGAAVVYATYCGEAVAGFYTLSTHSICRADIAGGWLKRNAPDQIPAVLLGMLGVDERFKGEGLGAMLLRDAIIRSLGVADAVGAKALVVDPSSESAASFYGHFGFKFIPGSNRMYLGLKLPRG